MKLISIFVNEDQEGLYAIKYDGEEQDEFHRLLSLWSNPEYVRAYLKNNEEYLKDDFFIGISFGDLAIKIIRESQELDDYIFNVEDQFFSGLLELQEIFRPLSDSQYVIPIHQQTKTSIENWKYRKAILRFYAIRISKNAFVITGGAIKLVKKMRDHPDTKNELENKLPLVRAYLASIDLINEDDLLNFTI